MATDKKSVPQLRGSTVCITADITPGGVLAHRLAGLAGCTADGHQVDDFPEVEDPILTAHEVDDTRETPGAPVDLGDDEGGSRAHSRQGDDHAQQHIGADDAAQLRIGQVEARHQVRRQGGDGLELIAEADPGEGDGGEDEPGASQNVSRSTP